MVYIYHNDYELLYLIEEGCEPALDFLYQKYTLYIKKIAYRIYPYGDKRYDLIQEGLMVLFNCLKCFNRHLSVPFFSYFTISLKRRFYTLVGKDHYYKVLSFLDYDIPDINYSKSPVLGYLLNPNKVCDDEIDVIIYQDHIINGINLAQLCEKNNISYNKAYKRKIALLEDLKKILTKS